MLCVLLCWKSIKGFKREISEDLSLSLSFPISDTFLVSPSNKLLSKIPLESFQFIELHGLLILEDNLSFILLISILDASSLGVFPSKFFISILPPSEIKDCAISVWPQSKAICNGVSLQLLLLYLTQLKNFVNLDLHYYAKANHIFPDVLLSKLSEAETLLSNLKCLFLHYF